MIEGFWIVQFAGMEGKGGGVVVLSKGQVFGGDSAYTYLGTYEGSSEKFKASIRVQNFEPAIGNVLGIRGDFDLSFSLILKGNELTGDASTPAAPGFGLKVRLTRRANLA